MPEIALPERFRDHLRSANLPEVSFVVLLVITVAVSLAAVPAGAAPADAGTYTETPTETPANRTADTALYEAGNETFDDVAAVERAIENDTLEPADVLSPGDALVVVIESPRLAAAMDEREGSTTERFLGALQGAADLRIVQTDPSPEAVRTYARVGPANVTAHRDGSTVHAVLDTGALAFLKERVGNESHRVDSFYRKRFAVDFGFDLYEPPWKPDDDGLFGPTFELTDEEYLTPTATPTPTPTPTIHDSPSPTPTATPTRAPSPTPTGTPATPAETVKPTESPTAANGPGFTVVAFLVAGAALVLGAFRRRRGE
ncbi:hypothetical protein BRC70_08610 [Halobacteriales archaeon QH_6_68_27]|jgi:hypothetical protein|nr:MAG: hypothetical protein BRC70_08610 [Halobacteriales archaeon QH_6_68_27]